MSNDPRNGTLRIDKRGPGNTYRVSLNDQPIEQMLSCDGLKIEFVDDDVFGSQPRVTMVFAPGALDIDLDAELVASILEHRADGA